MEASAGGKVVNRDDPRPFLNMPACRLAAWRCWLNAKPQFRDNFKRDAAAGTRFWRGGADLLAKLPKKPLRTPEQQLAADIYSTIAARRANDFLTRSRGERSIANSPTISRNSCGSMSSSTTLASSCRGLTPTRRQVGGRKRVDAKSRKTASRSIREFSWRTCLRCPTPACISATRCCGRSRKPWSGCGEFIKQGVIDFGPARVERQGKAAVVTVKNPRFLNAEDDDTLDDTETAADIAILDPMSEICVLARRRGRSSEIPRPQDFLRRHQPHPSLSRQNSLSLVHPPRHGRGEQDAARPGDGRGKPRRSLWRHPRKALDRRRSMSSPSAAAASICWRWTTWSPAATPI